MKYTRTLLILSALVILVGAFVYTSISQDPLIAEQVKILPKPFDLENSDDVTVQVKLNRDDVPVVDQIDPSTVLLEGFMTPISTSLEEAPPNFNAIFDGSKVASWVLTKIGHMTTPQPWVPIKIPLRISGNLYDGTEWEGVGEIKIYIPTPSDPPPPPPP